MKVVFYPLTNSSNKYIEILTKGLTKRGAQLLNFSDIFKNFRYFREAEIVHLNWYENLVGKNSFNIYFSFLKKAVKLLILRFSGKKIVCTIHNKLPHDRNFFFLKIALLRLVLRSSDVIFIHSESTKEVILNLYQNALSKLIYVPHPNYINEYPCAETSTLKEIRFPIRLLFFGAIRPYKNIEMLIDVLKDYHESEFNLTIAGNPSSSQFREKLISLVGNAKNINLNLRFIHDNEICSFLSYCDLVILPYDIRSSLNSGSAILAFSYRKTVICPEIGTISDLSDRRNVFSYNYESEAEHKQKLKNQLNKVLTKYRTNNNVLKIMGNEMYDYVIKNHDKALTVDQYLYVYRKLLK